VRQSSLGYLRLRGEGSIPVPLPPGEGTPLGPGSSAERTATREGVATSDPATRSLLKLVGAKARRTRFPIDWKDGAQILALAREGKEKAVSDALFEHCLRHPLAETADLPVTAE
jgi:hypothetical protein